MIFKYSKDSIVTYYNRVASSYEQKTWHSRSSSKHDYLTTRNVLLQVLSTRNWGRVLDVGCGDGAWTKFVLPYAEEVIGMDIARNMIIEAKKRFRCSHLKLMEGDFDNFPFKKDERFNLILMIRSLEYFQDIPQSLKKAYSLLKSGGKLVIVTKCARSIWRLRRWLRFLRNPRINNSYLMVPINLFLPRRLKMELAKCNFAQIEIQHVVLRVPGSTNINRQISILLDSLTCKIEKGFFNRFFSLYPFTESYMVVAEKQRK